MPLEAMRPVGRAILGSDRLTDRFTDGLMDGLIDLIA